MANIICLDDDPRACELLCGLLEAQDHCVWTASTVQETWRLLNEVGAVDLIILDNELQEEHGYDLLTDLREHPIFLAVPVLIYTGVSDRSSVLTYIGLKIQNILVKPYRADRLHIEINKAVQHHWIEAVVRGGEHRSQGQFSNEEYDAMIEQTSQDLDRLVRDLEDESTPADERMEPPVLVDLLMYSAQIGFPSLEEVLAEAQIFCQGKQWQDARDLVPRLRLMGKLLEGYRVRRCEAAGA